MIKLKEALIIHELAIEKFGGIEGIRDMNLLESAIQRVQFHFNVKSKSMFGIDNQAVVSLFSIILIFAKSIHAAELEVVFS